MSEISESALEETLKSLIDVAEGGNFAKGGVSNSGTYGSGGKQGGGQGSESDAGVIDNMMIAKMIQAGVDVQTAAAFKAFMTMEIEEDDDDDEETEKSFRESTLSKSFRETLLSELPDESADMVDITPFLNGITNAVGESLEALDNSILKSTARQDTVNNGLLRAVHQMGGLLKSQSKVIDALAGRLGLMEKAPVAKPKGAGSVRQVIEKSMPGEVGKQDMQLNKSQVLNALTYMNLNKGMNTIGQRKVSDIVVGLEGGNVYDQEIDSSVRSFLSTLPADEQARVISGQA